ncbi:MAG: MBL fold metallo-hydrolase, partial [Phycisphaerae bacterium]
SLAGEETVVAAPELNVCFDVGKAPRDIIKIDHVLLSHGHMDHAAGLAYYLSQRNFVGIAPGTVLTPADLAPAIRALMNAWGELEGHVTPANIVAMQPNQEHELRRGLVARAFAVNHGVPSLGYSVIDVRRKLKPEFDDKTGRELVELKKKGIEIQYTLEVPLIAYCGDTAEGAFLQLDHVRKARVLIIECTFYEPEHVSRARAGKHFHARDFARIMPDLDNDYILITHVTRRTGLREAKELLSRLLPDEQMARVRFLMEGKRRRPSPPPAFVQADAGEQ